MKYEKEESKPICDYISRRGKWITLLRENQDRQCIGTYFKSPSSKKKPARDVHTEFIKEFPKPYGDWKACCLGIGYLAMPAKERKGDFVNTNLREYYGVDNIREIGIMNDLEGKTFAEIADYLEGLKGF